MKKSEFKFILSSFLIWRIAITFVAILAIKFLPVFSENFFGGRYINYITNPLLFGWANFDGEHYLSIAQFGYKNLQQFFFPLYPVLVRIFGSTILSGIIVSNTLSFVGLIGLYKLIKLDCSEQIAKSSIILLLCFPTSFYFASLYTESLFLTLVVWSFYFFRTQKYLLSSIFGILLSATRIIGVILLPVYLIDLVISKKFKLRRHFSIFAIPLGLFSYLYYLYSYWGGPLKTFYDITLFGDQRSSHLIMLPQVIYRYFVKIMPNLNWVNYPVVFTTILELLLSLIFLGLIIHSFKKIKISYWLYLVLGYLIPTLSGSFSSMPRYVLVLFPAFILISKILDESSYGVRRLVYITSAILAIITQSLFFRGYFVS